MIPDKTFLGFSWPPKMASFKPKQPKHYKHHVLIGSLKDPDLELEISYSNEKLAREAKRAILRSTNNLDVRYEKQEQPLINEDGVIL